MRAQMNVIITLHYDYVVQKAAFYSNSTFQKLFVRGVQNIA